MNLSKCLTTMRKLTRELKTPGWRWPALPEPTTLNTRFSAALFRNPNSSPTLMSMRIMWKKSGKLKEASLATFWAKRNFWSMSIFLIVSPKNLMLNWKHISSIINFFLAAKELKALTAICSSCKSVQGGSHQPKHRPSFKAVSKFDPAGVVWKTRITKAGKSLCRGLNGQSVRSNFTIYYRGVQLIDRSYRRQVFKGFLKTNWKSLKITPLVWGYRVQFKFMNLGYFAEGSMIVTSKR